MRTRTKDAPKSKGKITYKTPFQQNQPRYPDTTNNSLPQAGNFYQCYFKPYQPPGRAVKKRIHVYPTLYYYKRELNMIRTKDDLKHYLEEDNKQFGNKRPRLRDWILHNECWFIYRFKYELRHIEYLTNVKSENARKLRLYWHYFLFKRLSWKMKCIILPNTCGPGLQLYHCGDFTHVRQSVKIGKNCIITVGTVFGHRKGGVEPVIVGDNCYFGIGCKILGGVKIGNNVSVGAYAVVVKDIPDNAVVAGIPAKIVKFKIADD